MKINLATYDVFRVRTAFRAALPQMLKLEKHAPIRQTLQEDAALAITEGNQKAYCDYLVHYLPDQYEYRALMVVDYEAIKKQVETEMKDYKP